MNIKITDVDPQDLAKLLGKLSGSPQTPPPSTPNPEIGELRVQVHQLAQVVERLVAQREKPQPVRVEYLPSKPQLQLPPAAALALPPSAVPMQMEPTAMPPTQIQEPGVPLPGWWTNTLPYVATIVIGATIGVLLMRSGFNLFPGSGPKAPTQTKSSPQPAKSSNLLKVPSPPAANSSASPPPPPTNFPLPAIPKN